MTQINKVGFQNVTLKTECPVDSNHHKYFDPVNRKCTIIIRKQTRNRSKTLFFFLKKYSNSLKSKKRVNT